MRRVASKAAEPDMTWELFCAATEEALKKLELTESVALYSPYYTEMIRVAEAIRREADSQSQGDIRQVAQWLNKEINQLEKMRRVGSYRRSSDKQHKDEEWE